MNNNSFCNIHFQKGAQKFLGVGNRCSEEGNELHCEIISGENRAIRNSLRTGILNDEFEHFIVWGIRYQAHKNICINIDLIMIRKYFSLSDMFMDTIFLIFAKLGNEEIETGFFGGLKNKN